jgi:hypothetical protein
MDLHEFYCPTCDELLFECVCLPNSQGVIEMNDKNRDPLEEVVGTVAFSMPDLGGFGQQAAVLLHVKVDSGEGSTHSEVLKWLMDVIGREGGEMHWDLCGMGDTTSPR